jgi:hypothetical protein
MSDPIRKYPFETVRLEVHHGDIEYVTAESLGDGVLLRAGRADESDSLWLTWAQLDEIRAMKGADVA